MSPRHNLLQLVPKSIFEPGAVVVLQMDPFELLIKTYGQLGFGKFKKELYTTRLGIRLEVFKFTF
jgi:hypothetical protein